MSIMHGLTSAVSRLFEKYTLLPLSRENFQIAANITLNRRLIALSGNPHPSSAPYISGDSFAHLADFRLNDDSLHFDPQAVQQGDVVFINSHLIHYFFRVVHPQITHPYVLISHNGDLHIDVPHAAYIDDKILHWFAQNVVVKHPKITPIPIGLENLFYYNHGAIPWFEKLRQKLPAKSPRILMEFSRHTNPLIREPVFKMFQKHATVTALEARFSAPRYLEQLASHEFVLSPPGNGLDCHRTWEAMYLKTIPIVEHSVSTDSFAKLGLPLWVVKDWDEVKKMSVNQLHDRYLKIQKHADYAALDLEFWRQKIQRWK